MQIEIHLGFGSIFGIWMIILCYKYQEYIFNFFKNKFDNKRKGGNLKNKSNTLNWKSNVTESTNEANIESFHHFYKKNKHNDSYAKKKFLNSSFVSVIRKL